MTASGEARCIDVLHLGREHVIGCWRVDDVLVDPGPASTVETLLAALGDWRPRALLLTHIHLDHAGASGTLARRWPELEIYVHEVGAPHLADPTKLLRSATRLYGDAMDELWGEMLPVPADRLRVLRGGETLAGDFRVAYTPGHASHHVSYLHEPSGRAFTGDVAGVRVAPSDYVVAPSPPPDIDVEAWLASIDLVESWAPRSLGITHFGGVDDVGGQLARMRASLRRNAELARSHDRDAFVAALTDEVAAETDAATAASVRQAAPFEQLYDGLERYWRKREAPAPSA